MQSERCKETVPLLKQAKRAILLTGTPALSRPIELFTQLDALLPAVRPSCSAKLSRSLAIASRKLVDHCMSTCHLGTLAWPGLPARKSLPASHTARAASCCCLGADCSACQIHASVLLTVCVVQASRLVGRLAISSKQHIGLYTF